jgi:hypothetical protein
MGGRGSRSPLLSTCLSWVGAQRDARGGPETCAAARPHGALVAEAGLEASDDERRLVVARPGPEIRVLRSVSAIRLVPTDRGATRPSGIEADLALRRADALGGDVSWPRRPPVTRGAQRLLGERDPVDAQWLADAGSIRRAISDALRQRGGRRRAGRRRAEKCAHEDPEGDKPPQQAPTLCAGWPRAFKGCLRDPGRSRRTTTCRLRGSRAEAPCSRNRGGSPSPLPLRS